MPSGPAEAVGAASAAAASAAAAPIGAAVSAAAAASAGGASSSGSAAPAPAGAFSRQGGCGSGAASTVCAQMPKYGRELALRHLERRDGEVRAVLGAAVEVCKGDTIVEDDGGVLRRDQLVRLDVDRVHAARLAIVGAKALAAVLVRPIYRRVVSSTPT